MKLRQGFVSNSSSSSFIVSAVNVLENTCVKEFLKQLDRDFYEIGGKLYTEMVYDGDEDYVKICNYLEENNISHNTIEGGNTPYDEYNYLEVEGECGISSVFIPKDVAKENGLIASSQKQYELYLAVKAFIEDYDIFSNEHIYQCDEIVENSLEFIETLCNIVGYKEREE